MCTFPGVLCICLTGWPILHGNTRNSRITWITRNKRRVGESVTVFLMSILRLGNEPKHLFSLAFGFRGLRNQFHIKLLLCRLLFCDAFISFVLCYKFRAPLSYAAVLLYHIFKWLNRDSINFLLLFLNTGSSRRERASWITRKHGESASDLRIQQRICLLLIHSRLELNFITHSRETWMFCQFDLRHLFFLLLMARLKGSKGGLIVFMYLHCPKLVFNLPQK